jgi:uncharacterized membrane protein
LIYVNELSAWIYKYYIYPIIYDTSYNPVDTITWAIVLGLAILGLIKLFKRLDLKMNDKLVICTIPYILAGASLRVFEDAELLNAPWKYLLITPLIFFLVFFITVIALLLCKKVIGEDYYRVYAAIGLIWTCLNLAALSTIGFRNAWVVLAVFFLGSSMTAILLLLRRGFPWLGFLDNRLNMMIVYAHMLDASSTYIGVDWFDYYEKHVVPTFLINITGSAAIMFPLKLLILLPVLSLIDKSLEDRSFINLIKLTLIVLGLAPAVRNTLRLSLGV